MRMHPLICILPLLVGCNGVPLALEEVQELLVAKAHATRYAEWYGRTRDDTLAKAHSERKHLDELWAAEKKKVKGEDLKAAEAKYTKAADAFKVGIALIDSRIQKGADGYEDIRAEYNSALETLKISIDAVSEPDDQKKGLEGALGRIKAKRKSLETMVVADRTAFKQLTFPDPESVFEGELRAGVPGLPPLDPIASGVSGAIEGVAKGVLQIWKTHEEIQNQRREAVKKSLTDLKMSGFEVVAPVPTKSMGGAKPKKAGSN